MYHQINFHMKKINTINFDTRTINDLIHLDEDLKFEINSIIQEEEFISKKNTINSILNDYEFITDDILDAVLPDIKDCLKSFMKKNLNKIELSVLKGVVNLNNVDYRYIVNVSIKD